MLDPEATVFFKQGGGFDSMHSQETSNSEVRPLSG